MATDTRLVDYIVDQPSRVGGFTARNAVENLKRLLESASEIFFMKNAWIGAGILGLGGLFSPAIPISGLVVLGASYGLARLLDATAEFWEFGYFRYNPLLVGFAIGANFQLQFFSILILISAGFLTFIVTLALSRWFAQKWDLTIITLPFMVVSWMIWPTIKHLQILHTSPLATLILLPEPFSTFCKTLGSIIFLPYDAVGLGLFCFLLLHSRILAFLALLGFGAGTFIEGMPNYNFILVAMGLGGIYVIPSLHSLAIAAAGMMMTGVLIHLASMTLTPLGLPLFVIPFVSVMMTLSYILKTRHHKLRVTAFKETPEKTLTHFWLTQARFTSDITIGLPFLEPWTVWQAFNGPWTHKGDWQYAYDFVIQDEAGKTYYGDGVYLDQYYAFRKPIVSPIYGQVTQVIAHLPDNPIGSLNTTENWGNRVLIRHEEGYTVEMSHFLAHSIALQEGQWVSPGTVIGLCGNSGYSPQPHLHIQVQWAAQGISPTLPFQFKNYVEKNVFYTHGLPQSASQVYGTIPEPYYDQLTTFLLGQSIEFEIYKKNEKIGEIHVTTSCASDGTFFWETPRATLRFSKKGGYFVICEYEGEDPYLQILYASVSTMPLHYTPGLTWEEKFPAALFLRGIHKWVMELGAVLYPPLSIASATYRFVSPTETQGEINVPGLSKSISTSVSWDPFLQIKAITYQNYTLRRKI